MDETPSSAITEYIKGRLLLAPMAGTTDMTYRSICRGYGAALTHTEMVSARGMMRGSTFSARTAVLDPSEHPIAIQIYGGNEETLRNAVEEVRVYRPDVIDLNAGCPDSDVCRHGAGAALLGNVSKLHHLVKAVVDASTVPVSVKVRLGTHSKDRTIGEIAGAVEDAGASYITVHGRSRYTKYEEPARWEAIALAVDQVKIPVIGNGDIFTADDALRMMQVTGCHAVLVARGSMGTPWIFRDFQALRDGKQVVHVTDEEVGSTLIRYIDGILREMGAIRALPRIRKNVGWYTRQYERGADLRQRVFREENAERIRRDVTRFFEDAGERYLTDSPESMNVERAFRRRVLFWMQDATRDEER